MPFEEARTRLLLGSVLRRAGHRSDARRELEASRATFRGSGRRSRNGRPVRNCAASAAGGGWREELTPVEQQIAELVAIGQTNREVAAATFTSVQDRRESPGPDLPQARDPVAH